jgi:4-amino-4-deoxy-L-arabinose transferase-like glycosyltransferase
VIGLALLLRAPIADIPLERDEGEYAYMAQRWLQGEVPYKHAFDQKPPAVFVVYAVLLACLGSSPAAIHWGVQLYTLLTAGLLFLLGRRLFSAPVGILAAVFLLLTTADCSVLGNAANTETIMILPMVAGLLAALRAVERSSARWALLSGMLSATAVLGKQVALPNLVFHLLLIVGLGRSRLRLTLGFSAGVLAVGGVVTGFFAWAGALEEFWDCVIGFNLHYASTIPWYEYPESFQGTFEDILWHLGPVFILAGLALAMLGRRKLGTQERRTWLIAGWLLFSFFGVSVGGFFRQHYFIQVLPAVSLLAAVGAWALARRINRQHRPRAAALVAGYCLAYALVAGYWYYLPGPAGIKTWNLYFSHPFYESLELGRYLAEHSTPEDTVFVYGSEPQVYFYAGRKCACRYMFTYPLITPYEDSRARQTDAVRELKAQPPLFLITFMPSQAFVIVPGMPTDFEDGIKAMLPFYELAGVTLPEGEEGPRRWVTPAAGQEIWELARRLAAEPDDWAVCVYRRRSAPSEPGVIEGARLRLDSPEAAVE